MAEATIILFQPANLARVQAAQDEWRGALAKSEQLDREAGEALERGDFDDAFAKGQASCAVFRAAVALAKLAEARS